MRCVDPFVKAGEVFPCGRCLPCKYRSRRIWFHRVLLEASQHDYNAVLTLTYDEAALPHTGELQPEHLRNWLKRYRKRALERYPWRRLRFFACGEYGEKSYRPHYHVVLFGQPGCSEGRTGHLWCSDCACDTCQDVTQTWGLGETSIDVLSHRSAAYVAGYVTRKVSSYTMGKTILPFIRMSNRPGIGANAMHDVASAVLQFGLEPPTALRHGSYPIPLGRYLRRKLHEFLECDPPAPFQSEAVHEVRRVAFETGVSQKEIYAELNGIYASQISQREAAHSHKGKVL